MRTRHTSKFEVGRDHPGASRGGQRIPVEALRVVELVEEILYVELHPDVRVDLPLRHGVEARIAVDVLIRRTGISDLPVPIVGPAADGD